MKSISIKKLLIRRI